LQTKGNSVQHNSPDNKHEHITCSSLNSEIECAGQQFRVNHVPELQWSTQQPNYRGESSCVQFPATMTLILEWLFKHVENSKLENNDRRKLRRKIANENFGSFKTSTF
jgi:hypothetical protein